MTTRIRDLVPVARKLDPFAFAKQTGPFVLMQRPPTTRPPTPKGKGWMTSTARLPEANVVKGQLPPVEFEDLLVATLPPPEKDGTLQLIIGRADDCDLVVDDPSVSGKHAAILWDGRVGVLRELGSSNGTFLNGLKLGSVAKLRNGDELSFGQSHFVYLRSGELYAKLLKAK